MLISSELLFFIYLFVCLFETGFYCVALAVLELTCIDQAVCVITEILLPLPPRSWN